MHIREDRTSAQPLPFVALQFYWIGFISIGTPARTFIIDFDTGSTDLWVPSVQCQVTCGEHACTGDFLGKCARTACVSEYKSKYDPLRSNTSRANGAEFRIAYGDGSYVHGAFVNDTVSVSEHARHAEGMSRFARRWRVSPC